MKRKFLAIGVVLFVGGVWVQAALALETLGPPAAAGLDQGQSSIGFDYSHSRMDLKLHKAKVSDNLGNSEDLPSWNIRHLTADAVTAKIGYGIANDFEGFVRLGALAVGDAKGKLPTGSVTYEGGTGFDLGFGAKATFWQQDNLKMGGIAQFSWAKPNGKAKIDWGATYGVWRYSSKVEIMEIQMAVGPTYQFSDGVLIYGGPFVHYIDGSMKLEGKNPSNPTYIEKHSADVIQQNYLGGFIGMQLDLDKYAPFINVEWQHTATDDTLGLNLTWKY